MSGAHLAERLRTHVISRGGPARHGNDLTQPVINQNGAWVMMLEAADEIERLEDAVKAEREACALLVETAVDRIAATDDEGMDAWTAGQVIAAYIRART